MVSTLILTHLTTRTSALLYEKKKEKENQRSFACQCSLRDPHVAIQLWPATDDLDLTYNLASDALEDIGGALGHNSLEHCGTLDEQESRKPERINVQPLAQHREYVPVRVVPSREDIHVPQREHHVIRWRDR